MMTRSGIATYSQAGGKFGLGMLWLAIFQYPLMTVVQEMCARVGLATGDGIAGTAFIELYINSLVFIRIVVLN